MIQLVTITSQLGVMIWPLTALSVIALMIILERLIFLISNSHMLSQSTLKRLYEMEIDNNEKHHRFSERHKEKKNLLSKGIVMLFGHRHFSKPLREEALSIWLINQRQRFFSGLRILNIIGVISPLIGLLGTVLGLITMFNGIAQTTGSITPATLADGLGLAMGTTAAGLLIALPAITFAQIFSLWASRIMASIEYTLNHCNLYLDGITIARPDHCAPDCSSTCQHTTQDCAV